MKLLKTSGSISLVLAAFAAGAPQPVTEPGSIDHEGRSAPVLKDAVGVPVAGDHDTQHQSRDASDDLWKYVNELLQENWSSPIELDSGGSANFGCHQDDFTKAKPKQVNPDWLRKQTLNKIDWLKQEPAPNNPSSFWFSGDMGVDWKARQTRSNYDNKVNEGDWVEVTLAWSGGDKITRLAATEVIQAGISACSWSTMGTKRSPGFAAILDGSIAVYLWVGNINDSSARKGLTKVRQERFWQTPTQTDDGTWDAFIEDWGHGKNGKPNFMADWLA